MTTANRHRRRSQRSSHNYKYYRSIDRANHGDLLNPTYKDSKNYHKYDGKGNIIVEEE